MAWVFLIIAGLFEVGWAVGLKLTHGFTHFVPSLLTVVAMLGSISFLGFALRNLPLGTAYAIWTGIGTIGTAIIGMILFGEEAGAARLVCIGLITVGIVGLKLVTAP